MKPASRKASATLIALAAVIGTAAAAEVPKQGSFDFTACWSGASTPIALSKTHSAFSYEITGTSRSASPGALFDNNSFHCIGVNASFDGKVRALAICESVDPEGDRWLREYSTVDGKTTTREAGTGKYDGMLTVADVEPLGPFPAIKAGTYQHCNHQYGTYKLK